MKKPPSSKKGKAANKAATTSSKKGTPKKGVVKIDESRYQEARELLLKSYEPITKTVIVRCNLKILLQNDHSESEEPDQKIVFEEIECHVVCTAVKPDFILKTNTARKVDFGMVAGGMRKKMSVGVENISENPIYLRLSHLNPIGGFSSSLRSLPIQCRNYMKLKGVAKDKCSVIIDPEEIRQVNITFTPNEGNLKCIERLDIEGGKTKVVLFLEAHPAPMGIQFNPSIDFYNLECGFGGHKEVDVLVNSTSKALQHLSYRRVYLKAIPLSKLPEKTETKAEKITKGSKQKGKTPDSPKQKGKTPDSPKAEKKTTSKGKSGKNTPQNLNTEEKLFFDNYDESDEKYEFEDFFSLKFEVVEKAAKSKKGKTESKGKTQSKGKNKNVSKVESGNDEGPQVKSETDLLPMGKCRLVSMFTVKATDQLQNSVRKVAASTISNLYHSSDAQKIQEQKLSSSDDLDSIEFYNNMVFVAKYKIILGFDCTVLDFYFVGKVSPNKVKSNQSKKTSKK